MKIVIFEGCTSGGIDIDKKDFNEFTKEEKLNLLKKLLKFVESDNLSDVLRSILDYCSSEIEETYEMGDYCDQCNDHSSTTTYQVPL